MNEKVTKLCHIWIILFCFCSRRVKQNRRAYESHLCMHINRELERKKVWNRIRARYESLKERRKKEKGIFRDASSLFSIIKAFDASD